MYNKLAKYIDKDSLGLYLTDSKVYIPRTAENEIINEDND